MEMVPGPDPVTAGDFESGWMPPLDCPAWLLLDGLLYDVEAVIREFFVKYTGFC